MSELKLCSSQIYQLTTHTVSAKTLNKTIRLCHEAATETVIRCHALLTMPLKFQIGATVSG